MPAKAGIHDFSLLGAAKSWMPTPAFARGRLFVGMTWGPSIAAVSFRAGRPPPAGGQLAMTELAARSLRWVSPGYRGVRVVAWSMAVKPCYANVIESGSIPGRRVPSPPGGGA